MLFSFGLGMLEHQTKINTSELIGRNLDYCASWKTDAWEEALFKRQRDLLDTRGTVSGRRTLTEDAHGLAALGEHGGE